MDSGRKSGRSWRRNYEKASIMNPRRSVLVRFLSSTSPKTFDFGTPAREKQKAPCDRTTCVFFVLGDAGGRTLRHPPTPDPTRTGKIYP